MTVKNILFSIIREFIYLPIPITEESNLYTDLGLDSLSFIIMLSKIEETYEITFEITEMEMCLQVGPLIKTVEKKIKVGSTKND